MAKLTIIANVVAKADKIALVKAELLKLIEPTRAEEGCINYDLLQDNKNPACFTVYENWESSELLLAHTKTTHFVNYMVVTEGAVESFTISEMTQIA